MHKKTKRLIVVGLLAQAILPFASRQPAALAGQPAYSRMAPLQQYLMPRDAEVALARAAAPSAISAGAEVLVLGRTGYTTAAKGGNGFVCLVERSWGATTNDPIFWDPAVRGPLCFNPQAASTVLPIYLLKTKLVLAGRSRAQIVRGIAAAFASSKLPALAPGAMSYMLAKGQYLGDQAKHWHPHLMIFVAGDATKSWGADLPGSPVMASKDPEERMTVFYVWTGEWSDGARAPM
ncbi:MAG TPA: hypothetical protein VFX20_17165 [Steroidobacteraceae bacterium]|nr:hypothetical protein [Steroidobacteraceae bacterium]